MPFEKGHKHSQGIGAPKGHPGWGGRPLKFVNQIKQASLKKRNGQAEKSFDLLVKFRDDEKLDPRLRRDCAKDIMEQIWGKAPQALLHSGEDGGPITVKMISWATEKPNE